MRNGWKIMSEIMPLWISKSKKDIMLIIRHNSASHVERGEWNFEMKWERQWKDKVLDMKRKRVWERKKKKRRRVGVSEENKKFCWIKFYLIKGTSNHIRLTSRWVYITSLRWYWDVTRTVQPLF